MGNNTYTLANESISPWHWVSSDRHLLLESIQQLIQFTAQTDYLMEIWDKGWHGGNRAETDCPSDQEPSSWIGCDECGLPDSQHHWIRESRAERVREQRLDTISKVRELLEDICTGKSKKKIRREIWNACSNILDNALTRANELSNCGWALFQRSRLSQ